VIGLATFLRNLAQTKEGLLNKFVISFSCRLIRFKLTCFYGINYSIVLTFIFHRQLLNFLWYSEVCYNMVVIFIFVIWVIDVGQ